MSADFTDIGIVDLDLKKTTWSRVHPAMRTLYLGLSRAPDLAWTRFFHEERESRIVIKRHGLWIEDGYIVFDCLLPDVERHHLPDFRLSIAYANRKSHELITQQKEHSEQQRRDTRAEQRRLAELRAHIRAMESAPGYAPANSQAPVQPSSVPITAERADAHPVEHDSALSEAPLLGIPAPSFELGAGRHAFADVERDNRELDSTNPASADVPAADESNAAAKPALTERVRDEFEDRRTEWRTRFRAALTTSKESDRGDD